MSDRFAGREVSGNQVLNQDHALDLHTHQIILKESRIPRKEATKALPHVLVVEKLKHRTHVLELDGGIVKEVLCVPNAVGKAATPTPEGRRVIHRKVLDPIWTPPVSIDPHQKSIQPYSRTHRNPMGVALLDVGDSIGMHGTNAPEKIGKDVSHGCIRHLNKDIMRIYPLVNVGTSVYVVKNFDGTKVDIADFKPGELSLKK